MAAASFIGLAEASRPWLNTDTGLIQQEPYFSGNIFHRVIPGFVIQAGSHDGSPAGGPGYQFGDEIASSPPHTPYVLSMANSGPWSNGSQFFVTLASLGGLDGKHTVFGAVTSGTNTVDAIAAVPTNPADRPITDVLINSVTIQRIGSAAQNFDVHAQGLPILTNLNPVITRDPLELTYDRSHAALHSVTVSTNLTDFTPHHLVWQLGSNSLHTASVSNLTNSAGDRAYYAVGRVQYETNALFTPSSLTGETVTYFINKGIPGHAFEIAYINGSIGGVIHSMGGFGFTNGYLIVYDHIRALPYRGHVLHIDSGPTNGLNMTTIKMAWPSSTTNGVFTTEIIQILPTATNVVPVAGTFEHQ